MPLRSGAHRRLGCGGLDSSFLLEPLLVGHPLSGDVRLTPPPGPRLQNLACSACTVSHTEVCVHAAQGLREMWRRLELAPALFCRISLICCSSSTASVFPHTHSCLYAYIHHLHTPLTYTTYVHHASTYSTHIPAYQPVAFRSH
jgi:hypothetical protein